MIRHVVIFALGGLFSVGLGLAGMTRPEKIIGFLDFSGSWDPSLAFVMGGAVMTYVVIFRLALRRPAPLLSPRFMVPTRRDIDWRLISGAALFGIGWGLGGLCPAPALATIPTGATEAAAFVASMVAGMWLFRRFDAWLARRKQRAARPRDAVVVAAPKSHPTRRPVLQS